MNNINILIGFAFLILIIALMLGFYILAEMYKEENIIKKPKKIFIGKTWGKKIYSTITLLGKIK
jgi:hypothetical protein